MLTLAASSAQAVVHGLQGNARFQVGNGLPLPVTPVPLPDGAVVPASSGPNTVMQTAGKPGPKKLSMPPGALTAPGSPVVVQVWAGGGSNIFQVKTAVPVAFPQTRTVSGGPAASAVFSVGGRTGAMTETYCPGSGATPPFACASPAAGTINGLMRYTATRNQFGGPARANTGGSADIAMRAGSPAPCSYAGGANPACIAIMALATPAPSAAQGAPFGAVVSSAVPAPASGLLHVTVTGAGKIVAATPTPGMAAGLPNPYTSYGGPWTTGRLTVSVTLNVGLTPEIFIFSGSDRRAVNGRGTLSLVSGSVSARLLSGPNANRGWLNLEIGPPQGAKVPGLPAAGLAAFGALAALVGARALRRRTS